jgi:hypothetical protein
MLYKSWLLELYLLGGKRVQECSWATRWTHGMQHTVLVPDWSTIGNIHQQ